MCSKCFKETQKNCESSQETKIAESGNETAVMNPCTEKKDTAASTTIEELIDSGLAVESKTSCASNLEQVQASKTIPAPAKATVSKGRCGVCRLKIPLVKQATNKCRCDKVFCDVHKFPDQHQCTFDFLKRDRKELEKKNPKLDDLPRGGRSFNRIG
ncbi:AN1-type zinc finger protein-like protein [Zancudomyces culisetae]|uniref:AN1-type zinc finger protein-like protein n=1 Tax=Zancudomyces culisetae TaxID=1213189 RepID=A0A1R1PMQ3_ZANCU|nr:AN1-type zinc finger protein-like protein [Zancudomyces culisetae]|eukprot:OMH82152.1 AN1-type zinc finger protein-like protein [Zancudomyces culisetae]